LHRVFGNTFLALQILVHDGQGIVAQRNASYLRALQRELLHRGIGCADAEGASPYGTGKKQDSRRHPHLTKSWLCAFLQGKQRARQLWLCETERREECPFFLKRARRGGTPKDGPEECCA